MRYLEGIAALVDQGLVRSHLSDTLMMGDVRAGYDRIESGRTVGKLAVKIAAVHRMKSTNAVSTGREATEANNKIGASS